MKASPRQQQLLLELQDLDTMIARLRRRRSQLPEREQLTAMQHQHRAAKAAFMEAQRQVDTLGADIGRIESDVETVRLRCRRDEELLASTTSPKEAQALQSELAVLARRQSELEDRQLELMETNERAQQQLDEAGVALAALDTRSNELKMAIVAAEQEIDAEIARTVDARGGLAAELQRDLLDLYEDLRGRLGVGVARLRGNVSEASNMALTPAELSDIFAIPADELAYCPSTGAILVREIQ